VLSSSVSLLKCPRLPSRSLWLCCSHVLSMCVFCKYWPDPAFTG
jgi:hypothetical protein